MLVHIKNQFIELAKAGVFVGLLFSTVIRLDDKTGRVFGIIARGKNTFVQDRRDQGQETIDRNA